MAKSNQAYQDAQLKKMEELDEEYVPQVTQNKEGYIVALEDEPEEVNEDGDEEAHEIYDDNGGYN